jgi:rhodanese-related sulfurtransferase
MIPLRTLFSIFIFIFTISISQAQEVVNLGPSEFLKKYENDKNAMLIDVRTDWEYKNGHLKNSKNFDWMGDSFMENMKDIPKEKPLYIYCHSGGRSSEAAQKLMASGYKNVYNMSGGFSAYSKAKLPYEK